MRACGGSSGNPGICTHGYKDYDRLESYDGYGRPAQTSNHFVDTAYVSANVYDAWSRLITTTETRGSLVKTFGQRYNNFGYLAQVVRGTDLSGASVLWQASGQDAADRVTTAYLGNGLEIGREYYAQTGRLNSAMLGVIGATSNYALQEGYSYDNLGNVKIRTQYWNGNATGFSETFTYDELNRLSTSAVTNATTVKPQQSFNYDGIGNIIIGKTGVGSCTGMETAQSPCYVYPVSGAGTVQPHAVSSINGLGSFTYDANGNMLTGNGRSTTWMTFDMPNTITQGGQFSQFVYGPEHQRTKQARSDMALYYAGAMEADVVGNNATVKTYWPMGLGVDIDAAGTMTPYWTHTKTDSAA